jgi:two-component system, NarL family, competent response regulator ComA
MIKVFMVDDHKSILSGTKLLLEQHDMLVTICYTGIEALQILQKHTFDIMIYDLNMPDMNGLELTMKTLEIYPDATILIFTGEDVSVNYDILIKAGVSGIIEKSCSDKQLIASISMALEQMIILPLSLIRKLHFNPSDPGSDDAALEQPLTEIELEILQQVSAGKTNKDIAAHMQMATRNVEYHLTHIYQKLKVTSRVYAIRKAVKLNLIVSH